MLLHLDWHTMFSLFWLKMQIRTFRACLEHLPMNTIVFIRCLSLPWLSLVFIAALPSYFPPRIYHHPTTRPNILECVWPCCQNVCMQHFDRSVKSTSNRLQQIAHRMQCSHRPAKNTHEKHLGQLLIARNVFIALLEQRKHFAASSDIIWLRLVLKSVVKHTVETCFK